MISVVIWHPAIFPIDHVDFSKILRRSHSL